MTKWNNQSLEKKELSCEIINGAIEYKPNTSIKCSNGYKIKIKSALYGGSDSKPCLGIIFFQQPKGQQTLWKFVRNWKIIQKIIF